MARTLPTILSEADLLAYMGVTQSDSEYGRLMLIWRGVEAECRRFVGYNLGQPADPYIDFLPEKDRWLPSDPLLNAVRVFPTSSFDTNSTGPQADAHILPLSQGLVRSITEVRIDISGQGGTSASDFPSETIIDSSEYYLDLDEQDPAGDKLSRTGFLIRPGGWPLRRRSVKVTYVAGFTEAELDAEYSDVRLNVIEEVAERVYSPASTGGAPIKSERLGDWSVAYGTPSEGDSSLSPRLRTALQPFVRYRL